VTTARPVLSCGLPPGPEFAPLVVLAEQWGYSRAWIFDSAPLWEDPFAHLALAARDTSNIGLGAAVLIPTQRSAMAMAAGIATIDRISGGRFRPCFGTGATARLTMGQRPMTLAALAEYTRSVRALLAGETVIHEGRATRMLHAHGLTAPRPVDVEIWLSAFGPRGTELSGQIADGLIGPGPVHPTLPTATLVSGTVLDPGEDANSSRVREAIGPWRVVNWHHIYANAGSAAVDALPGGRQWRETLERLAPDGERHLLTYEGHVTHLAARDRPLLDHIDIDTLVGDSERIGRKLCRLGELGFAEVIYTPSGPDVARELQRFAMAYRDGKSHRGG
jgi:5,10-methylenetetrahydromethanopterin reductase